MRRSGLAVAVVLLFSAATFAQHSGGGSSGGSSGGGGGSHGGGSSSAGSSGGSSGGHSSGGSGSSSSSHSSGSSRSSSSSSSRSSSHVAGVGTSTASRGDAAKAAPQKRGFLSFLRHPFRKPERKPVANLRHAICIGPCPVCPAGQAANGKGGCGGGGGQLIANNRVHSCSHAEIWSGGDCLAHTPFLDNCSGLETALQQQAARMQTAEAARQTACASGGSQECSDMTTRSRSEASLYQAFQERYQQCRQQTRPPTWAAVDWTVTVVRPPSVAK